MEDLVVSIIVGIESHVVPISVVFVISKAQRVIVVSYLVVSATKLTM
jgi:hypothetical protein